MLTRVFVLLAAYLCVARAASVVVVRQTTSTATDTLNMGSMNCSMYSYIANFSTVGTNSSYRAAFLQSTTDGTHLAASILNAAEVQLPMYMFDTTINEMCGNFTALAIKEAANNYTRGVVLGFNIAPNTGVSPSGSQGLITLFIVIIILFVTCGTWSAL